MTVIRPNSVSGITSITAQANEINFFRSNGTLAGLQLNGVNFNTTTGISTFAALKVTGNLDVEGVLTYQDVTNVDSLGIGTFRTGINVSGGQIDVGSNIKLGNAGVITATSFVGSGANLTGINADLVNDSSPQLGGDLDVNGKKIKFPDLTGSVNNILYFGTGDDLLIYHLNDINVIQCENARTLRFQYWTGSGNETLANFIPNGEVQLYNNNTRRLRVTSGGISVNATDAGGSEHWGRFYFKQESGTVRGLFDPASQKFQIYDNSQFTVGNSHDAVFYHDGSNTFLVNNTGNIYIQNDGSSTSEEILIRPKGGENSIRAIANGAIELYHDNVKALSTSSTGINVWGNSGNGVLDIYPTGSAVYSILNLHNTAGGSAVNAQLIASSGQSVYLGSGGSGSVNLRTGNSDLKVVCNHQGEVRLYHNVTQKFTTKSWGAQVEGTGAFQVPDGSTGDRPTGVLGMLRVNTSTNFLEMYGNSGWVNVKATTELGTANNPAVSGKQLYNAGKASGNYYIKPNGYTGSAIECYVDNTTHGGGWVLVASFTNHSGFEMSSNTGGLNQSTVKNYATSQPPNGNTRLLPKNFINYLAHQNTTNGSDSDYSIMGVHGRSGTGYVHWEVKANSSNRTTTFDFFKVIYRTQDANNNMDVKIRQETSTQSTTDYVGKSISGSYTNYNQGRGGTSDGNGTYHYLIDDYYGGYEWAFRENADDIPGSSNGFNLSVIFIR